VSALGHGLIWFESVGPFLVFPCFVHIGVVIHRELCDVCGSTSTPSFPSSCRHPIPVPNPNPAFTMPAVYCLYVYLRSSSSQFILIPVVVFERCFSYHFPFLLPFLYTLFYHAIAQPLLLHFIPPPTRYPSYLQIFSHFIIHPSSFIPVPTYPLNKVQLLTTIQIRITLCPVVHVHC